MVNTVIEVESRWVDGVVFDFEGPLDREDEAIGTHTHPTIPRRPTTHSNHHLLLLPLLYPTQATHPPTHPPREVCGLGGGDKRSAARGRARRPGVGVLGVAGRWGGWVGGWVIFPFYLFNLLSRYIHPPTYLPSIQPHGVDGRYYNNTGLIEAADLAYIMMYDTRSQILDQCVASANAGLPAARWGLLEYLNLGVDPQKLILVSTHPPTHLRSFSFNHPPTYLPT